jgi:hypothetical protein
MVESDIVEVLVKEERSLEAILVEVSPSNLHLATDCRVSILMFLISVSVRHERKYQGVYI